jgi:peptide/nickel transport system permease protein
VNRLLKSLISQAFLLVFVFSLTFMMVRSLPGDIAKIRAGEKADAATVEKVRKEWGLDKPLYQQYFTEAKKIFIEFDAGTSHRSGDSIFDELGKKLPATIELATLALLIAIAFGIPLGMLAARYRGRWLDVGLTQFSLLGVSVPVFLLGYLMLYVCKDVPGIAGGLRMPASYAGPDTGFIFWGSLFTANWEVFTLALSHIILPALALATIPMSIIMRLTRSAFLEVLGEDFLRTARAKGLNEFMVYFKHILRVASPTLVTVIALQVGFLASGAVLTETIFSWPGMGRYLIDSINARVYPAIQTAILLFTVVFILVHFLTDFLYVLLDPRIRSEK